MNKQEKITKTTGQIIKENLCTLFNLLNLLIASSAVNAMQKLFTLAAKTMLLKLPVRQKKPKVFTQN